MAVDSNSDSMHFGLDGETISSDSNDCSQIPTTDAFEWLSLSSDGTGRPADTIFSGGLRNIDFWMSEDGAKLDRLLLTTESSYDPANLAESVGFSERLTAVDLNNNGRVDMVSFAIFASHWLKSIPP